ncbi:MAG: FG-GAP repeat protein [Euryarchaeota archaeon]|nr:FG-GAP repeat protein [Euryarchaeota archaeon]
MKSVNDSEIPLFVARNNGQPCTRGNWTEIQKLLAPDGSEEDSFGQSVSLDGDTALIGAYYDDHGTGSVYVFTRTGTTWTQQAKLLASDIVQGDWFGYSVSLDGDTALIGAYMDDGTAELSGSAYVFIRSGVTWTQQAKLLPADGAYLDAFAASVSLSGDNALIGTPGDDDNGANSGSAYVFTRTGTTWTQQQKLLTSDGATEDEFGCSVSVEGDTALIGTCYDDDNGIDSGSAYIFTRTGTTWTQQQKLLASDGTTGDLFGFPVTLNDDTVLIAAFFDDDNGNWSGSAYMFIRTGETWIQQQKLFASDLTDGDWFGYSISLDGDTALIGSPHDNDNGIVSGAAYIFTRIGTSWTQQEKLLSSDGTTGDEFGLSVCLDGDTAIIGAPSDDNDKGSMYVFTKVTENQSPNPPTVDGPASGKPGISYNYNFIAVDPDGDDVYYWIEWGDESPNTGWIGPYPSGQVVIVSHTFSKKGTFIIKCQAKDINNALSEWGQLSVTMPCSYSIPFMQFWIKLIERFHNAFPILRYILSY